MVCQVSKREKLIRFLELKERQKKIDDEVNQLGGELMQELGHGRFRVNDKLVLVTVDPLGCGSRIDVIGIPQEMK